MTETTRLLDDIRAHVEAHGIRVGTAGLGDETAGTFDGLSVTLNEFYDLQSSAYYLVHAFGSIVAWGLDPDGCQAIFQELDGAKQQRRQDPDRLERAIERYRWFEVRSSEYAVWVLAQLGHADGIPSYTNFFRADLESMTQFHRTGHAPVWRDFFAAWNRRVARGECTVLPFEPRPVPDFRPVRMRKQEVKQEHDGKP